MYQERFEELKQAGSLPTPSGLGLRILALTQDENCSLDEIVRTIQADPALTGRIIRLATSVQQAARVTIATAKEASVRLGLRTVSNVALGFSLISGNRAGKCEGFDYDSYWSYSLANAVAAQIISKDLDIGTPAEVFTCALLSRIGRLALASVHPTAYTEVLRLYIENPRQDLASVEQEFFYIDHRQVAAAMLEEWGLPPFFSESVLHLHGGRLPEHLENQETADYLRVLGVSSVMAEVCITDEEKQPHLWPSLRSMCSQLGIASAEMCRMFDQASASWSEWGKLLSVPTSGVSSADVIEARAQEVADEHTRRNTSPDLQGGLRVLAVDDDPVSLKLLVTLVQQAGHQVFTARNGKEALAVFLEENPQMVITDWMMPEMDGIELCKQLRLMEAGRKLYILILTGRAEEERIVEAFEAGADDYIVKPFNPRLLKARIRPGVRVILLQKDNDRQVHQKEELNARLSIEKRKLRAAAMTDF